MSKSFKQAPKPALITPDQISAFEKGGLGHDTRLREPVLATPAEPTKRLSLDLPVSKHTRFKTACSATNRKMVSEIEAFIDRRIAELETEAGIFRT
jgi:hypothetical protein